MKILDKYANPKLGEFNIFALIIHESFFLSLNFSNLFQLKILDGFVSLVSFIDELSRME